MLYDRDFTKLTTKEAAELNALQTMEFAQKETAVLPTSALVTPVSTAVRFHRRLFPNFYLDPGELQNFAKISKKILRFEKMLSRPETNERDVLNHIRDDKSYFIVGSLLQDYFDFGHHEAYLIPEFMLGTMYKVDYLLIGKNSGGFEFVCVELESPSDKVTIGDGAFGKPIRSGLSQTSDWDHWLGENFAAASAEFRKHKSPIRELPNELVLYDRTRIHYVVVAGRRGSYTDKTYRARRRNRASGPLVLHYDNLLDAAKQSVGRATY